MSSHSNPIPVNMQFFCMFRKILKHLITCINLTRITHRWRRNIINVCYDTSASASKVSAEHDILISPSFDKPTAVDINKQRTFLCFRLILIHMYQSLSDRSFNFHIPFFSYMKLVQCFLTERFPRTRIDDFFRQLLFFRRYV